jgi:putative methionine-R-sulfoxide reductase with GAF domain
VPVFAGDDSLIAVLDIDSGAKAMFDETDAQGLEALMRWFRVATA